MPQISEAELTRLREAVAELSSLNQIANAINVSMSIDKITSIIVDQCCRRVKASQGAIFLLDDQENDIDKFTTFVRQKSGEKDELPFHLNLSLQGWMVKHRSILLSNDPMNDERLKGMDFRAIGLKSIAAAPLMSRTGLIGVIVLFNKEDEYGFIDADARFLGIVGAQAAKVIENAKLFEHEQELQEIQKELKIANSIQKRFLPEKHIKSKSLEVVGFNEPAQDVGGDYYDMIELPDNRMFLSIGDVSGKGLPAALLMSNAQAVLRSHLLSSKDINLPELATCLNELIFQFTLPGQYITTTFGVYDSVTGKFTYINAGHLPPMIVRTDGTIEKPRFANLVIGVMASSPFKQQSLQLNSGDLLVLYTDGITEANNRNNDMIGDDQFDVLASSLAGKPPTEFCKSLISSIDDFRNGADKSDDTTILVLSSKRVPVR